MINQFKLLDHGYVKFIESWGSDERIVEAARMSTDKGFLGWGTDGKPGDERLLKYLWEHKHSSPFEMGGCIVEVQAPIFVFREWHRHRTQSFNEMSGRYIQLPNLNYVPTVERLMLNAGTTNKQAGTINGAKDLTEPYASEFIRQLSGFYTNIENFYQASLSWGIPKELARIIVPVGRYSRMRVSANLLNWLKFLTLRLPDDVQWETRMYAQVVHTILKPLFPRTMELFDAGIKASNT